MLAFVFGVLTGLGLVVGWGFVVLRWERRQRARRVIAAAHTYRLRDKQTADRVLNYLEAVYAATRRQGERGH